MADIFTLTVKDPSHDRRGQECQRIEQALLIAAAEVRRAQGAKTSGTIIGNSGASLGAWTYTPTAST